MTVNLSGKPAKQYILLPAEKTFLNYVNWLNLYI